MQVEPLRPVACRHQMVASSLGFKIYLASLSVVSLLDGECESEFE